MKLYGLLGYPLSHSFSKQYFEKKFVEESIEDVSYTFFELPNLDKFKEEVLSVPHLEGFNITIPYKEKVMPFLSELDDSAKEVGAVNVVKKVKNGWKGYNSDYYGFKSSLLTLLKEDTQLEALVFGTGGASKAVIAVLKSLGIAFKLVSRSAKEGCLQYSEITKTTMAQHRLLVNTTPLGMHPNPDKAPPIPYEGIGRNHFLFDLVYNPETTRFMQFGEAKGASTKNGYEMLVLQAEKSWEIWN